LLLPLFVNLDFKVNYSRWRQHNEIYYTHL